MKDQISSAFIQLVAVIILSAIIFGIYKIKRRKKSKSESYLEFVGIGFDRKQFDLGFWGLLGLVVVFGIACAYLQYNYSSSMRPLLVGDSSPIGKILKNGISPSAMLAAFVYCFIQAGAAEEILFRGIIAKKLFKSWGFVLGNLAQALIFWIMHLLIFRLITGGWFNFPQLMALVTSFGLGLVFGYSNYRNDGKSILPSWILHGAVNYASFLGVAIALG